jgi:hypothetical protein
MIRKSGEFTFEIEIIHFGLELNCQFGCLVSVSAARWHKRLGLYFFVKDLIC